MHPSRWLVEICLEPISVHMNFKFVPFRLVQRILVKETVEIWVVVKIWILVSTGKILSVLASCELRHWNDSLSWNLKKISPGNFYSHKSCFFFSSKTNSTVRKFRFGLNLIISDLDGTSILNYIFQPVL
jgi:hypothetical protein